MSWNREKISNIREVNKTDVVDIIEENNRTEEKKKHKERDNPESSQETHNSSNNTPKSSESENNWNNSILLEQFWKNSQYHSKISLNNTSDHSEKSFLNTLGSSKIQIENIPIEELLNKMIREISNHSRQKYQL